MVYHSCVTLTDCHSWLQWPAVHGPVRPQNASLRLYGGAAFERCLDEFQEAAHVVQFPNGNFPLQWGMHLGHMHPATC